MPGRILTEHFRFMARGSGRLLGLGILASTVLTALPAGPVQAAAAGPLDQIETVVVIFAENRSFDNLYNGFPGADTFAGRPLSDFAQRDRDGSIMRELPPVWGGLTGRGVRNAVTQAMSAHLPNQPFRVDDPKGFNVPLSTLTHDLWHRFYENQMQINGGRNDMFVAWADSGAMPMSYWDGSRMRMWDVARKYTMADHFFMGAFGGSFLNHQWLACACAPFYPQADTSPAHPVISVVDPSGKALVVASNSPHSALDGVPKFVRDGNLTPDFHAVNTMQPAYQPSGNPAAAGQDARFADPGSPTTLPPQTEPTIGDRLSERSITWAWYSGAWQDVLDHGNHYPAPDFQYHHQPYNYYLNYAPDTAARQAHLRDGGLAGARFIDAIDHGTLPQVAFYKPQGNLNEHSGYADIQSGDQHIADLIDHLEKSPQWPHMLVIVTYDENGGLWDHVAPPKGDRWGPGSRIPAIIVSPYARRGYVDHTVQDTTSILKFLTERFHLRPLDGLTVRDRAIQAATGHPLGDLTTALDLHSTGK
ncbi:acid phosphatase [Komagataeibacter oboediens]|uniref:Acid phosphatase n=1 Tax=Komagataeibacter oboediens TaxID=65958 RepID=A0ABS5SP96_9PROT|nr:acid phosphatase [Komagataeibacter oboediens]MBL7232692.1 acid phosphatase [Komagataeibacter oboediens]MBT0676036.1 acid phosphatase [Komagataeibacter oboediens]MBT0679599.1 acid phosphatase [Komagataeibacter oboediens]